MDRRVYRKAAKRYGLKVQRVCFIEGRDSNVHFHFIAQTPERMNDVDAFKRVLLWITWVSLFIVSVNT